MSYVQRMKRHRLRERALAAFCITTCLALATFTTSCSESAGDNVTDAEQPNAPITAQSSADPDWMIGLWTFDSDERNEHLRQIFRRGFISSRAYALRQRDGISEEESLKEAELMYETQFGDRQTKEPVLRYRPFVLITPESRVILAPGLEDGSIRPPAELEQLDPTPFVMRSNDLIDEWFTLNPFPQEPFEWSERFNQAGRLIAAVGTWRRHAARPNTIEVTFRTLANGPFTLSGELDGDLLRWRSESQIHVFPGDSILPVGFMKVSFPEDE